MKMDTSSDHHDTHMDDDDDDLLSHAEHKENGNLAYKAKDYRGAIMHYTLAIETASPDSADSESVADRDILATYYNNRAAAATMILQYKEALEDCDSILSFHPSFIKAFIRKAKVLTITGQLNEAIEVYRQALAILDDTNGNDDARNLNRSNSTISTTSVSSTAGAVNATSEKANIASFQKNLKTLVQRVTLIQSLLQINNDSNNSSMTASSSNNENKHLQLQEFIPLLTIRKSNASQALKQINLILSTSCPDYKGLLPYKLQCLIISEQYNDAYTLSSTLLRSSNNDCMTLYYRSYILYRRGMIQETLNHLKQILRMNPDHALSQKLFKALKVLQQQKDAGDKEYKLAKHEMALENYTRAIENPICIGLFKSKLYYNRSCALFYLKKYTECIEDCSKALEIDDEYVKVYIRRGNAYVNLESCTERDCMNAIGDYEKAIELSANVAGEANEKQMKELKTKIHETKVQIKRLKQKDFYKILNVSRNATQSEMKKSYHKLARTYHPDKHSNKSEEEKNKAEVIFKDINLAYEVLSDETKKRKYDSGVDVEDLDNPHAGHGQGHGGRGHGGIDQSVLFEMFMRQQHGGMGGGHGGGGFSFG